MKKHFTKKRVVLLALVIVALAVAGGVAFAYFSSTGTGTGNVSVGSSSAVVIHGTTTDTLYPGTSATVHFSIDNPSPGHEYVQKIHLASVDTGSAQCDPTWFTMSDVTVNQDFPSGNGQSVTPTGTLNMANAATSQDACQGANLTLHFTSS
jgi:hypothetical protein